MKIQISRWYIVIVARVPGTDRPLCIGAGLPAYRDVAMNVATDIAESIWRR